MRLTREQNRQPKLKQNGILHIEVGNKIEKDIKSRRAY
jgi:hypothetical protein